MGSDAEATTAVERGFGLAPSHVLTRIDLCLGGVVSRFIHLLSITACCEIRSSATMSVEYWLASEPPPAPAQDPTLFTWLRQIWWSFPFATFGIVSGLVFGSAGYFNV